MTTLCDKCLSYTKNKNCSLCILDVSQVKTDEKGMNASIDFIRREIKKAKSYEAKKTQKLDKFTTCSGCGMSYNTGFCDTCD